jgi:hypothetical protein
MLAEEVDYVIGVDTHRDQHTLAVVVPPTGAVVAQTAVRASGTGYVGRCGSRADTPAAFVSGRSRVPALRCRAGPLPPTTASLKRSDDPPPTQPRRRPPAQSRAPHRDPAPPPTPGDARRYRATRRRRQDNPRSDARPQALPGRPPLPRAERNAADDLTVIGDSFPNTRQAAAAIAGDALPGEGVPSRYARAPRRTS